MGGCHSNKAALLLFFEEVCYSIYIESMYMRMGVFLMFEFLILGFLSEASMHGYELKLKLNALAGYYRKTSDGTLYPAIKRLVSKGLVVEIPQEDARGKYLLEITPEGFQWLKERLEHPEEIDITDRNRYFGLLNFLHLVSRDKQVEILERRRDFILHPKPFNSPEGAGSKAACKSIYRDGMVKMAKDIRSSELGWLEDTIRTMNGVDPQNQGGD